MISKVVDGNIMQFANIGSGGGGDTPEPVVPVPDGATVTPVNDVQTWLACAGIDKPYTSVPNVISDSATFGGLVGSANAVDYMVRSTDFATDICADEDAMTIIGLNNHCSDKLLDDADWRSGICDSEYFERVLNFKIPEMTSAENDVCLISGDDDPYMAFRSNSYWVRYDLTSACTCMIKRPVKIYRFGLWSLPQDGGTVSPRSVRTFHVAASYNNITWFNLTDVLPNIQNPDGMTLYNISKSVGVVYPFLRFISDSYNEDGKRAAVKVHRLQFYGREDV